MSFLSDLINKAKSLIEDPPKPTRRNVIDATSFDRDDWKDVQEQSPTVREEVEELSRTVDYAPDLMADLHAGFFKVDPRIAPSRSMADTHQVNHAVISEVMKTPEVQTLRQHTVGDKFSSAMGMQAVQGVVVETMQRVREARAEAEKRAEEAAKERAEAQERMKRALEAAENAQSPLEKDAAQGLLEGAMDQFAQAQDQFNQAKKDAQQASNQAMQQGVAQARSAAKGATEDLDQQEAMCNAFGVDPGDVQKMSVEERLDLARKLKDNRLAEFIKLLGQFKMVQQAESRKRVINAASEVHGITTSNHLERMVAGEYLNFADPSLELLMLMRWAEHQLNTYDVRGKENLGQGPIVVVVDESGSMGARDVAGGTREAWSKALALAMLDQARHRKRDFVYIGFGSPGEQHMVEFPKGESDLNKTIQMTEHFFAGGTHYEKPLMMALEYIQSHYDEKGEERPDIVFITDDAYTSIDESFLKDYRKVKDKVSIRTYGIALGCDYSGALESLSDNVRSVTELVSDPRHVGDLFRSI